MKKAKFEKMIKELKLEKVCREGKIQTYSKNEKEFYRDRTRDNLYGCYYHEKDRKYIIFFSDAERGIVIDLGYFNSEEDAYDELFKIIQKWDADYKKEMNK